jgi:hypothetical protein
MLAGWILMAGIGRYEQKNRMIHFVNACSMRNWFIISLVVAGIILKFIGKKHGGFAIFKQKQFDKDEAKVIKGIFVAPQP